MASSAVVDGNPILHNYINIDGNKISVVIQRKDAICRIMRHYLERGTARKSKNDMWNSFVAYWEFNPHKRQEIVRMIETNRRKNASTFSASSRKTQQMLAVKRKHKQAEKEQVTKEMIEIRQGYRQVLLAMWQRHDRLDVKVEVLNGGYVVGTCTIPMWVASIDEDGVCLQVENILNNFTIEEGEIPVEIERHFSDYSHIYKFPFSDEGLHVQFELAPATIMLFTVNEKASFHRMDLSRSNRRAFGLTRCNSYITFEVDQPTSDEEFDQTGRLFNKEEKWYDVTMTPHANASSVTVMLLEPIQFTLKGEEVDMPVNSMLTFIRAVDDPAALIINTTMLTNTTVYLRRPSRKMLLEEPLFPSTYTPASCCDIINNHQHQSASSASSASQQ